MQKGCQKSHAVTIKLEQLVHIYVVSQKQDEETEMFGKDNQVRKTTQASVASLFFFPFIIFVTVVVNIHNSS